MRQVSETAKTSRAMLKRFGVKQIEGRLLISERDYFAYSLEMSVLGMKLEQIETAPIIKSAERNGIDPFIFIKQRRKGAKK